MTTILKENGYTIQTDGTKLVVTDEGYGTVETFDHSKTLVDALILEYNKLKMMAE